MTARIILLNGTSSAGKSTLAAALRPLLPPTFCYYASDQLADGGFQPPGADERWRGRPAFFTGFHRSIAAFATAGLDLLVEHVIEQANWAEELQDLLRPFDVFRVGVGAPLELLEERERLRGDRAPGEAREHLAALDHCAHDFEIESIGSPVVLAERILRAWEQRRTPSRIVNDAG